MSPYSADDLKRLAGTPEPAWLWDSDRHRIVWANRAGLIFWREATLIDLIERRFDPDLASMRRIAALATALGAGEWADEIFTFHPRDGERTIRAACRPHQLDDGRTGLLVVASSAEIEPAGEGARASLIEGMVEILPIAIAVFDTHGSLVFANAACRDMVAGEAGPDVSVLGEWLGDNDLAADLIARALSLGGISEVETVRTRFGPRAHRLDLQRFAAPIHGRTALLASFEDIEDRRRIDRGREREQSELEAYLAAAADVTFALDERLRLTSISQGAGRVFDVDLNSLIGREWPEVALALCLDLGPEAASKLGAMEPLRGALAQITAPEGKASVVVAAIPVSDAQGRPIGLRGTIARLDAEFAAADIIARDTPEATLEATSIDSVEGKGSGDEATFSAIGRAVAANADSEAAVVPDPGGDRSTAALRVVGGVDHPPGEPGPVAEAIPVEPRRIDAATVGSLDTPTLVHRAFEIVIANEALAGILGYSGAQAILDKSNLLQIFPEERARLFSLQGRIDDGDTLQPGEIGIIPLRATTAACGSKLLLAHVEQVTFDGEIAVFMRFEDPSSAADSTVEQTNLIGEAEAAAVEPVPVRHDELGEARNREAELRAILNSAADGIATLDADGCITTFNATAETIFDYDATEVVGKKLSALLADDSGRVVDAYLQSVSDGSLSSLHREGREVEGLRKGGTPVPLYLTIGRMKMETGPKFCAVIRDITQWVQSVADLRREKEQAEQASSKKSDFLARISHELRTPLNAIIGFSEVMSEEKFGPIANDRYKGYLTDIRMSGEHLLSLINDLLDLSKVEAGKLELNFTSVDLAALIQQCISLMQPQSTRERVIMRTSLPDQLPPVVADERSIRQILLNILSNAIKFTPPGGQVILSALLDDTGRVQIRIRDTGAGMNAEQLINAMEPFRQIDAAMHTTPLAGTGLGLPLTKALTEANRAEFRIESTPQAGTLVQIIFPSERVLAG